MTKKISKNLQELRNIALVITKERRISVTYSETADTASIDLKSLRIELSPNIIPKQLQSYPKSFQKCLDAQVVHESGHYVLTRPMLSRYERFEKSKTLPELAHLIVNIIEDKRVNNFTEKRYRYDIGKRLSWFRGITRKAGKSTIESKIQDEIKLYSASKVALMINQIIHVGLYDGDINPKVWKTLNKTQQDDIDNILKLMIKAKFTWIKQHLVDIAQEFYQTIEKHVKPEDVNKIMRFVPNWLEGGELSIDLSEEDEEEIANEEEAEEQAEKDKEDLNRGGGAGRGTGDNINAPEPNFNRYFEYVQRNSMEINNLLNKLKKLVKPITKRAIFQRRGRLMNPLISRAYVNSLKRTISNIYLNKTTTFEKQKVAMAFTIDLSGSMDLNTACDTVTIMNEVFGNWLDDESYAILCFGSEYVKIKTFFESFNQTRARVGGLSCMGGTMFANCSEDIRKMFHSIIDGRKKIYVVCSDFDFADESDSQEVLKNMINEGIDIILIGLCNSHHYIERFLPNQRHLQRTIVNDLKDLPEQFLDVYMKSIEERIN